MLRLEDLAVLVKEHPGAADCSVKEFCVGPRFLRFGSRKALMGVVNLSADSWYRESVCLSVESAVRRGRVLDAQGADIVDLGAESTILNSERADALAQNGRLLPVVRDLAEAGIAVSVETYDATVARACLEAGAAVLNLTGNRDSEAILRLVAERDAAVILCFVQGDNVREVKELDLGPDPVGMLYEYFAARVEVATRCGVEKLFIDPGLGFYYRNLGDGETRVRHQMRVFLNTFRLRRLGFPVCHALPHAFETFGEEVRCAEPFFAVLAALGQTDLLRTHEVARTRAVLDTLALY